MTYQSLDNLSEDIFNVLGLFWRQERHGLSVGPEVRKTDRPDLGRTQTVRHSFVLGTAPFGR
jgi:hypothetical protein